jgi:hypothetical protein
MTNDVLGFTTVDIPHCMIKPLGSSWYPLEDSEFAGFANAVVAIVVLLVFNPWVEVVGLPANATSVCICVPVTVPFVISDPVMGYAIASPATDPCASPVTLWEAIFRFPVFNVTLPSLFACIIPWYRKPVIESLSSDSWKLFDPLATSHIQFLLPEVLAADPKMSILFC